MKTIERCHLYLSLFAGLMLGLAIGLAAHWSLGLLLFVVWVAVHGLTWGFAETNATPSRMRNSISEISS